VNHEREAKTKNGELRELEHQKECLAREAEELKVQQKLLEEARDGLRHDLLEANRKLREGR